MSSGEVTFFIPIVPTPKGRPRTALRNGRPVIYTPKKTLDFENFVKTWLSIRVKKPIETGVILHLEFNFVPPKSWTKKKKTEALRIDSRHTIKPDLDNLEKSVMDAAEGVLYLNDCQVWQKSSVKRYSEQAGIRIDIKTMS